MITPAEYGNFFGKLEECFATQVFFAQLNGSDTPVQCLMDDCTEITAFGECSIAD